MREYTGFPKIPRLFRDIVITEKIDGTNACVWIDQVEGIDLQEYEKTCGAPLCYTFTRDDVMVALWAGSRKRFISIQEDNHGFAKWVFDHAHDLVDLGPGKHYGEWWGQGINRNYGLKEKRFSLFNVEKWGDKLGEESKRPKCCGVVPVLYHGPFEMWKVREVLDSLRETGSYAAPFFMKPEGIVVYHTAGNLLFKATLENDEKPKGEVN